LPRDVHEALGIDFRWVGPQWRGPVRAPHDGVHYDIWGAGYRRVEHGFGGVDLWADAGPDQVQRLHDRGFRGLKFIIPPKAYHDPAFYPVYEHAPAAPPLTARRRWAILGGTAKRPLNTV
jgi:hypothetical protein